MELYIPPPSSFLPRLPPPRPVVPAVPIVPIPDLPDTIHAPEGAYTLNPSLFPSIGIPSAPLPYETGRPSAATTFIGGAGGFIVPPPNIGPPPGQTAMSFGSTVVNGQTQPGHPVRMSFVNVWFPPKGAGDRGLGGLLGMGGGGKGESTSATPGGIQPVMTGYEPSVSSGSDSPPSSNDPPPPIEVPLAAIPQASSGRRNPWSKSSAIPANALSALPRPKNNLRSSNSTFVTRLQAADNLPKIMAERGKTGNGELARWGFWNLGRTFGWGEEGGKIKEPLARVTFSQVPTCHAVSQITASPERLDIVVGFASGDLVWLDFILGRYTRINKGGLLNNTSVISVNFDPRQPQHFIAAFADSTVLQFNLFAEDPIAGVMALPMPWVTFFDKQRELQVPLSPSADRPPNTPGAASSTSNVNGSSGSGNGSANESGSRLALGLGLSNGSVDEGVYEDAMMIWKNEDWAQLQLPTGKKDEGRSPWAGKNPTAAYRVGRKAINAMAYSPDGRILATVSEDGMLRIIDVQGERLTDTFAAYFGPLTCVAWSPDSRFVAVGGQDDLIAIFSPRESRLVARCQGHSAFICGIAFDPARGGGGGGYRFGSVGEDGKLILWDFSAASLHRPRHHHPNASHHRLALGSTLSLTAHSQHHDAVVGGTNGSGGLEFTGGRFHPAPPRSEVALLQPVLARVIEGNLLTSLYFSPSAIVTVSRAAGVKIWQRPPKQSSSMRHKGSAGASAAGLVGGGMAGKDREKEGRELRSPREGTGIISVQDRDAL